ncbi:MAG: ATP-dependent helicase HrpB [Polyangiaceae bacterium]
MTVVPLPIDEHLPQVVETLKQHGALVLSAEPGAGKTTRVPAALLAHVPGQVWVSEPRRVAARLAARRVAEEQEQALGQGVGYRVRFEDVTSAETRLCYATEGVLLQRLLRDPELNGVSAVVLDELHERSLNTDLCLSLVERMRRTQRKDLWLVVMSATLESERVAEFLDCPRIAAKGRSFPLTIEYQTAPDERPLEKQVSSAVRQLVLEADAGDVLVFVPGAREIRNCLSTLSRLAEEADLTLLGLHGDLPLDEQAKALGPAHKRKVVVATNVAESSVTVPGVTAVVDSGLARRVTVSPWSGLGRLSTVEISRASADQRAGRAGRVRAGRALRLYSQGSYARRPAHDLPEIARADLAELLLQLLAAGLAAPGQLAWLTPAPEASLRAAEQLLTLLGAVGAQGELSALGRRMEKLSLHPRLARLIVAGEDYGAHRSACMAAALLSERDIRRTARARLGAGGSRDVRRGPSDVLELMDCFDEARASRFSAHTLTALELDRGAVHAVERAFRQLAGRHQDDPMSTEETDTALQRALLSAYPDRLARRKRPGGAELILTNGRRADLAESSVVKDAQLLVAVDADEGNQGRGLVRLASAVEAEWLLDGFDGLLTEFDGLEYNEAQRRVERVTRLSIGSVVLDEHRSKAAPSSEASALLATALATRLAKSPESEASWQRLLARLSLLTEAMPDQPVPKADEALRSRLLREACSGAVSLDELGEFDPAQAALGLLEAETVARLQRFAPERLTLASGRSLEIQYVLGQPPFAASRLQDFFGMSKTPSVADGRVPITLHLLAPNRRAVQVTSDLLGFWQRHYPTLRKTLMRRYPKHAWPEDGLTASPPPPGRLR